MSTIPPNLNGSLHCNGHFPGEPGLAGFTEAMDDGNGGENWSHQMCKIPVTISPPINQHPASVITLLTMDEFLTLHCSISP